MLALPQPSEADIRRLTRQAHSILQGCRCRGPYRDGPIDSAKRAGWNPGPLRGLSLHEQTIWKGKADGPSDILAATAPAMVDLLAQVKKLAEEGQTSGRDTHVPHQLRLCSRCPGGRRRELSKVLRSKTGKWTSSHMSVNPDVTFVRLPFRCRCCHPTSMGVKELRGRLACLKHRESLNLVRLSRELVSATCEPGIKKP